MTLQKEIKNIYKETKEIREAAEQKVDISKIQKFVIGIFEIFQETVEGSLIDSIEIAFDKFSVTRIYLRNGKEFSSTDNIKKSVGAKLQKLDNISLNDREYLYLKNFLKKYCKIKVSENNSIIISLK